MKIGNTHQENSNQGIQSAQKCMSPMPRIGGPRKDNRRILRPVAQSIILYGAPIWQEAMDMKCYRNILLRVQKQAAIRTIRAYRITSTKVLLVLVRTAPVHLLAKQTKLSYEDDKLMAVVVEHRMEQPWTKPLIQELRPWLTRKHSWCSGFSMTCSVTKSMTNP